MLPYLVIAAVVILIDLVFGIRAAQRKGDRIRISRAIRRTIGKAVEYFCWAVLASSMLGYLSAHGVEFTVMRDEVSPSKLSALASQRAVGKCIFGKGCTSLTRINVPSSGTTLHTTLIQFLTNSGLTCHDHYGYISVND